MFSWIRRWTLGRRYIREAKRRAVAAFDGTGRGPVAWIDVLQSDDRRTIIRVCFGNTRPANRSWFLVPAHSDGEVRELTFEEVAPMGEVAWR
jgi:hypothetical protein